LALRLHSPQRIWNANGGPKKEGANMQNVTTNLVIVVAALMAVAGVASAQTMEAKIPFAFRLSDKVLAPGTYQVRVTTSSGTPMISIAGAEMGQHVLSVGSANGSAKKAWASAGNAVLSFQCGANRCALSEVWMGNVGTPVYRVPAPRLGKDEAVHTAEIVMQSVKAD
jgi:hypothetical protein